MKTIIYLWFYLTSAILRTIHPTKKVLQWPVRLRDIYTGTTAREGKYAIIPVQDYDGNWITGLSILNDSVWITLLNTLDPTPIKDQLIEISYVFDNEQQL